MVHLSRGNLHPPGDQVRSEVAIVCQLARTLLGPEHPVPWERFAADYDAIRDSIAAVVPGCADNRKVRQPTVFQLPHPPRDSRDFPTLTGKANFTVNPLTWVPVPPGRLILQTLRSHDQYNTTIYGLDDRYRGVKGGRRVVFVNPADMDAFGLRQGDRVDLVSSSPTPTDTFRSGAPQTSWRSPTHPGWQRGVLLPPRRTPGATGSRCRQIEYARVEGDRDPAGKAWAG